MVVPTASWNRCGSRNDLQIKCGTSRKRQVLGAMLIPFLTLELCGVVLAQSNPDGADDMRPKEVEMSEWRVQSLAGETGLASQGFNNVCFETNGTAWVATSDGLYRYDGYNWTNYSLNAGLPSPFVRSVLMTRAGKLWVGTDKGAGIFNSGRFTPCGADHGLAGPSVRSIFEDPDGTIWFCSDTWPDAGVPCGLTSLSPDGHWTVYRMSDGLPSSDVFSYFRSQIGDQFVMTGKGVAIRDGHHWLAVQGLLEASEQSPAPNYMAELPSTGPVCFCKGSLMSYQDGKWRAISENIAPLQDISGFGPVLLPWMVSSKGEILKLKSLDKAPLRICRLKGQQFEPISPPITRPVIVDSMVEAPDGAIWCMGSGLLTRWDRYGGEWKEFINLPPPVSMDKDGSTLFSDGRKTYKYLGGTFDSVNNYQEAHDAGKDGNGWKIADQEVWQIRDGKVVKNVSTIPSGIKQGQLLIEDCEKLLWLVGTDVEGKTRIAAYTGGSWNCINAPDLLDSKLMRKDGRDEAGEFISSALTPDPHGGIWFAIIKTHMSNVLICRVTSNNIIAYPLNYPRMGSLAVAPDGQVFACGTGGTFSLEQSSGKWQPVNELAGRLIRTAIQRGKELWCFSDAYTGGKFSICLYISGIWTDYILPVTECLGKTGDGTVYFAGKDCLYFIPSDSIGPPKKLTLLQGRQPTSVLKDQQGRLWISVSGATGDQVLCYSADGIPPRTIIKESPSGVRSDASFRPIVTGIERYVPQNQQRTFLYSWRFDDTPWNLFQEFPAQGLPVAGLSLGHHMFQVRAQDEGGDTDPTAAKVGFAVLAIPLQERGWFKPSIIIVGLIVLGLSVAAAGLARRTAVLFRDLFANAPVAYHELDLKNRIRRVNDTELKMLGYSREEMLGHNIGEFILEDDAEMVLAEKVSGARTSQAKEWNIKRKDGTLLPVLMEDRPIKRQDGSIFGIRSTLQDITSRKQAEMELLRMHHEITEAHSQLKELNEQLKRNVGVQIIARQQAETEFVIVSTERNRVARELHDTLEQSLAGIALRMDAIRELIVTNPEMAQLQLETTGDVLRQSQMEVRRTVWGLRALALEQSNLVQAVKAVAEQITENTSIQVLVQTVGEVVKIPKIAENHLLRICQEAIANALKHGHARVIKIRLAFDTNRMLMTIQDDGCGFVLNSFDNNGREHHFGLLGMQERVHDIGGQLSVKTRLGAGTTIEVNLPLNIKVTS